MKSRKNIKSIVVMTFVGIISLFFINMSLAANTAKISVDTANLRETANEDAKILELLSMNQEVEIVEKQGSWYKVKAQGITGYLREDLLTVNGETAQNENTEAQNTQINQEQVPETQPTVETEPTETVETSAENTEATTVEEQPTEEVQTTDSELGKKYITENIKLKIVPVINAANTIELKKDEEVNVSEVVNGWAFVETQTARGWIRKEKLQNPQQKQVADEAARQAEEAAKAEAEAKAAEEAAKAAEEEAKKAQAVNKTMFVKEDSTNLRKEANTTSEIITTLAVNTAVNVTEEANEWSKVTVSGKEGYILTSLLAEQRQETSRGQATPRTAEQATQSENNAATTSTAPATSGGGNNVVETAKKYLGTRYVYGGTTPSGFDCSGFTQYVFKQHGVSLSRTAAAQAGNGVSVDKSNLQPGDLVFFYSPISHVGIYVGGGSFIHASSTGTGVTTSSLNSGYYTNKYVGARRVM